jgi:hypothetical protein
MFFFSWLTPLLCLAAFILLLLVTLSTPIIQSIYLFKLGVRYAASGLGGANVSASARFGVWGYCTSAISARYASFAAPRMNHAHLWLQRVRA